MLKQKDSKDVDVGDVICVDAFRRLVVIGNDAHGIDVMWYTPNPAGGGGLGPYYATLPHAQLYQVFYEDESLGCGKHYEEEHPDFTGAYRQF